MSIERTHVGHADARCAMHRRTSSIVHPGLGRRPWAQGRQPAAIAHGSTNLIHKQSAPCLCIRAGIIDTQGLRTAKDFLFASNLTIAMRHSVLAFVALTFSSLIAAQAPNASNTTYLTAPALVTTPENTTTIQCWRLKHPFTVSTTAGTAGSRAVALGNVTNLGYVIQPPRFDGGLHNAPVAQ